MLKRPWCLCEELVLKGFRKWKGHIGATNIARTTTDIKVLLDCLKREMWMRTLKAGTAFVQVHVAEYPKSDAQDVDHPQFSQTQRSGRSLT